MKRCQEHIAYEAVYVLMICIMFAFCVCSNAIVEKDARNPNKTVKVWDLMYQVINAFFLIDLVIAASIYGRKLFSLKPGYYWETVL